jgi:uncharacterized OB-fold protein
MNELKTAEPALYDRGSGGDTLDLLFLECGACSSLTFPSNAYGCRVCGASGEEGKIVRRPGVCTLHNVLTVHQNLETTLKAPYVVGEVELAQGIVEEAVLAVEDESVVAPGMTVHAVATPHHADASLFVCRFAPLKAAQETVS